MNNQNKKKLGKKEERVLERANETGSHSAYFLFEDLKTLVKQTDKLI